MSLPIERELDHNIQIIGRAGDVLSSFGARIAAWLLAGNGAALVLLVGAQLDGKDISAYRESIWDFAYGLGTAFLGCVASYFAGWLQIEFSSAAYSHRTEMAKAQHYVLNRSAYPVELPSDDDLRARFVRHEDALRLLPNKEWRVSFLEFLSWALFSVAAVKFGLGAIQPLLNI